MNTRILIIIFHEIAIKYESELKTQFIYKIFLRTITRDSQGPFTWNFVKRFIYLRRLSCYQGFPFMRLLSYDLSKISAKLVISLKHNIIFAKFPKILLGNNVTASPTHTHSLTKQKLFGRFLSLYFPIFY